MSHTSSAVTYTSVYTDSEPGRVFWGADEELSDGGPPRVIVYGYDGLPMLPKYKDDKTEDVLVDYPIDGGDDGDDDDGDSFGYDANNEDEEEEEEEEHLAPADSAVVIPTDKLVSPPEGTKPIIPPPSTDTTTTGARITIRPQTSISLSPEAEVERLLAMPTPSPSPLTLLSPPSAGEHRRDDIPKSEQPPCKRLCLSTLGSRYEIRESSTRGRGVDYGFVDAVRAETRHRAIRGVGTRISQRVAMDSQRVDLLMVDRMTLQETVQQTEMARLRETDRVRQSQIVETLRVMRDMRREMGDMQAELLALHGQPRRAGQLGGDARVPNHQDAPRDADSHI
uniref:Reverse transcriptase domain-containing protein n=1 Tax=Tanacetum cinerariifolium TaxID=118510 RepID=A0A699J0H9_TANCI|nr:hypothetical protein [Tanacetum cinerariifolium]GFA03126.1 hypothetical protein [Tanacetum cinerariifolium]